MHNNSEAELLKRLLDALEGAYPMIVVQLKSNVIRGEITRRPIENLIKVYEEVRNQKGISKN